MPLFGGPPNVGELRAKGKVKGLIKALGYMRDAEDMAVKIEAERLRQDAAEALGQIGDTRAVEPLIVALKDPWTDVRRAAAEALGQIGDARAVEPLLTALKEGDVFLQPSAAKALGQISDARAVEPLIAALKNSAQVARYEAAEALGRIGDARAVEPLIAALKDEEVIYFDSRPSATPAMAAAEALGKIGDPRALEPLMVALKEERVGLEFPAFAGALTRFGAPGVGLLITALANAKREDARDSLAAGRTRSMDAFRRVAAAEALGQTGDARALAPLVVALKDPVVGEAAGQALVRFGASGVEHVLAALQDEEPHVRRGAAAALKETSEVEAVEPLIVALRDRDGLVRRHAAEALGTIRDRRAVQALIAALEDEDGSVCGAAADALGAIGDSRAVEPLQTSLENARERLGHVGAKPLVDAILLALTRLGAPGQVARVPDGYWESAKRRWSGS